MELVLILLAAVTTLYMLGKCIEVFEPYVLRLLILCSSKQHPAVQQESEPEQEVAENIKQFRERIEWLKENMDDDGIYTLKEPIKRDDFSGVEIVDEKYTEML